MSPQLASSGSVSAARAPLPAVQVDLPRYMGDWYLIASIPIHVEKDAHNPMESYALKPDGSIATTFRKRRGSFEGELKKYSFTGFVRPGSGNSVWDMRIIWPFRAEYRIAWLEPDYSAVIIARSKRDHVWIMSRVPLMDAARYEGYVARIGGMGYDTTQLVRFPQRWPEEAPIGPA